MQIIPRKYSLNDSAIPHAILAALNRPLLQTFKDAHGTVWQATQHGLVGIDSANGQERVLAGKDGLPILSVTGVAGGPDGRLWLASNQGAENESRWKRLSARKLLQDVGLEK